MSDEMKMRKQFEKTYSSINHETWFDKDSAGEYTDAGAWNAWLVYKLALSSLPRMTGHELRMLIIDALDKKNIVCGVYDADYLVDALIAKLPHILKETP